MKKINLPRIYGWMLVLAMVSTACGSDDEPTPIVTTDPDEEINNWIYDVMDEVYYWTSSLPAKEDLNNSIDPEDYFDDLLFTGDRFSFIVEDYQDLLNLLEGVNKEAGYEFTLFQDGDNVVAQLRYVKNNSPAKDAGLKRGDVIYAINGQTITLNNYQTLLRSIDQDHTVNYSRFSENSLSFEDQGEISLQTVVVSENPSLIDTVYTFNDRKIGYYFYTFFSPGPGSSNEYDVEMDEIFAEFKSEGITDMILDLRYNNGGSIGSARNLASLLAPGVSSSDILYENQWNALYTNYFNSLPNGDDILRGKFYEKPQNIGDNLIGQTLYVLVGSGTASASELIINGLSPYMNVEIIGVETYGKNVGSIDIQDEDNPENNYGMLPIVLKTFNSLGQSDYDNGFVPSGSDYIDENQFGPWFPVGDIRDPLLGYTVEKILGALPSSIQSESFPEDLISTRRVIDTGPTAREQLPMIFDFPGLINR